MLRDMRAVAPRARRTHIPRHKETTMRPLFATLALTILAACAPGTLPPPGPTARLPFEAAQGGTDPTRAAIITTSYWFADRSSMANPGTAARAVANLEYLTVALPQDPRYVSGALAPDQLLRARTELRNAIGIAPDADPQLVVDGLYIAARSLDLRDRQGAVTALTAARFPDPSASVDRLSAMPQSRAATEAAAAAMTVIRNEDVQRDRGTGPGGDPGAFR
jgi:hypothetical protein